MNTSLNLINVTNENLTDIYEIITSSRFDDLIVRINGKVVFH
jgi:hypothetical protein